MAPDDERAKCRVCGLDSYTHEDGCSVCDADACVDDAPDPERQDATDWVGY